jgi:phasin family protein
MLVLGIDQFAAVQQAQLSAFGAWGNAMFQTASRLAALNLQATRTLLVEQRAHLTALTNAHDWAGMYALQGDLAQPATEKAFSYARHVQEIAADAQSEYQKLWEAALRIPAQQAIFPVAGAAALAQ